jgi:hypothetical protein
MGAAPQNFVAFGKEGVPTTLLTYATVTAEAPAGTDVASKLTATFGQKLPTLLTKLAVIFPAVGIVQFGCPNG